MTLRILIRQKSGEKLIKPTPQTLFVSAEWRRLSPSRHLPPEERPDTHVLELVSGSKDAQLGAFTGFGHTFIRLISVEGEVYSVGFYPDESTGIIPEYTPALTMPGMLLHPDKYDEINKHEICTRIPLTPLQFDQLKRYLEEMQKKKMEGSLYFRLLDHNCVWFVTEMAAQAGVHIDARYSHLSRGLRKLLSPLHRPLTALGRRFPLSWRRLLRRGWTRMDSLVTNAVYYLLGGRVAVRKQWMMQNDGSCRLIEINQISPMFPTVKSVFGPAIPCLHVKTFRDWQRDFHSHEHQAG